MCVYLLSGDEAQEPAGEKAVMDDERQLSLYEPLRRQLPESPFGPLGRRTHVGFLLLHLCSALIKTTGTSAEDWQLSGPGGRSRAVF